MCLESKKAIASHPYLKLSQKLGLREWLKKAFRHFSNSVDVHGKAFWVWTLVLVTSFICFFRQKKREELWELFLATPVSMMFPHENITLPSRTKTFHNLLDAVFCSAFCIYCTWEGRACLVSLLIFFNFHSLTAFLVSLEQRSL